MTGHGISDSHSHILYESAKEMTGSAKARGVTEFSITEHVSQFREMRETVTFGSVHSRGRVFSSIREYLEEFGTIQPDPGIVVERGLEVDFSPRYEALVADFVNREDWDVLLCSVHELEDGRDIEASLKGVTDRLLIYSKWYEYFRLQQVALDSESIPFHVLSHPVRMSRATKVVPPELDELLLDLASTARRTGKALELNGNDVDYAPELVRRLASACSKANCTVSIGSDAHHPGEVARNMEKLRGLVGEFRLKMLR